jgi:hypothetical protein
MIDKALQEILAWTAALAFSGIVIATVGVPVLCAFISGVAVTLLAVAAGHGEGRG